MSVRKLTQKKYDCVVKIIRDVRREDTEQFRAAIYEAMKACRLPMRKVMEIWKGRVSRPQGRQALMPLGFTRLEVPERCPTCGAKVNIWPCLECNADRRVAVLKQSILVVVTGVLHFAGSVL